MSRTPASARMQVVQAYDRAPIAEVDTDDAAALEAKLATATRVFRDRNGWPTRRAGGRLRRLPTSREESPTSAGDAREGQAAGRRNR